MEDARRVGRRWESTGADPYLSPDDLRAGCPVPFHLRICNWHMRDLTLPELQAMYRRFASYEPAIIQFGIEHVADFAKFLGILEVARELNGEASIGALAPQDVSRFPFACPPYALPKGSA